MMSTITELLAPAGDYDCFLAAIHAGADAVYLGGNYSARAYAKNFTQDELLQAIDYAHLHERKVYMTLNTVMKDEELNRIPEYLLPFYEAGLDGVIVQDIGLFTLIRTLFPKFSVHASTQMTVTDLEGVKLLSDLGASRVVLARELSLREISRIHDRIDTELECFIHGALCYSYSGKCLMSSMIGGRSGNRGRCAQPCRLPYNDSYPLSCKDICTLPILPKLISAGITSYKIEGRMKSAGYVAGVTGIYRKYFDRILQAPDAPYAVDPDDLSDLISLYTRGGNSDGYYEQRNGRDMITLEKSGYEKSDAKEHDAIYDTYTEPSKIPVTIDASFCPGEHSKLTLSCERASVTVQGDVAETARNRAMTEEEIRKQLVKLGGTEFDAKKIQIDIQGDVFLPVSALNALRRAATDALKEQLLRPQRRPAAKDSITGYAQFKPETERAKEIATDRILLHVQVLGQEQAKAAIDTNLVDRLTLPLALYPDLKEACRAWSCDRNGSEQKELFLSLPYICREDYFGINKAEWDAVLNDPLIGGFVISNYESLEMVRSCRDKKILADLHLYAMNHPAVETLQHLGVTQTTVPVEENKRELIERNMTGEDLIVYGRLPLMVSAQCVQKTLNKCMHEPGFLKLKDRYNVKFPVYHDCINCCNVIYNSVPVSLHDDAKLFSDLKIASARLAFTDESAAFTADLIRRFSGLLLDQITFEAKYPFTRGHMQRGVE